MFLWIPKIDRVIRVYCLFIDAPCIQAILNILGTLPSCFSSARRIYSSKQYNGDENFAVNCFWRLTERSRAFDRLCLSLSVQPLCWSADALPSSWPNEFQNVLYIERRNQTDTLFFLSVVSFAQLMIFNILSILLEQQTNPIFLENFSKTLPTWSKFLCEKCLKIVHYLGIGRYMFFFVCVCVCSGFIQILKSLPLEHCLYMVFISNFLQYYPLVHTSHSFYTLTLRLQHSY